jgi:type II secretory pathway component PulM
MTTRERNILMTLGLVLLVGVTYVAGRWAFPELWPWF